jgi:hypothetical protein
MPKGEAKGRIVPVRFNRNDLKAITEAAKVSNQTVSERIRNTLNTIRFIEVGPEGEELDRRTKAIIDAWGTEGWVNDEIVSIGDSRRHMRFHKKPRQ